MKEKLLDKKEKTTHKKKSFLPFTIIALGIAVIVLIIYLSGNTGGLSGNELAEFNAALDSGTIEEICTYVNKDLNRSQMGKLNNEIYRRLDDMIIRMDKGELSSDEFALTVEQIYNAGIKVDEQKKFADTVNTYEKLYNNAYNDYLSGESESAEGLFEEIRNKCGNGFKGVSSLLEKIDERLYYVRISLASKYIKEQNFDRAKELAEKLKEKYPDDARVQNLVYSCTDLEEYTGPVQHIFFHPLIAYPERAFDSVGDASGQDNFMVTVSEFNKTISQLHERGYCLIDINDLYTAEFDENGRTISVTAKKLYLPRGKKPLILSVDDVNYYEYMKLDGQVFKLVLDDEGNVVTYSVDMEGNDLYSKENGIVPLLDTFVEKNPDFSMNWAKGCLAVTGFDGVLGYNTDEPNAPNYEQEKADAIAVCERLKETGWVFASHSQGHRHSSKISLELFKNDTDRWAREALPIIGPTSVYIYPFGEAVPIDGHKFDYMKRHGFAIFCTVSSNSNIKFGSDYVVQGRRAVDGIAYRDKRLYDLLDVPSIIDPVRPSYNGWHEWAKVNGIVS